MDAHTTETYKGWTIEIHQDDDGGESPREWDNLGFMACWHRRSWLGDNPKEVQRYSPEEYIRSLVYDFAEDSKQYKEWKNFKDGFTEGIRKDMDVNAWLEDNTTMEDLWELFSTKYVYLPIYAYEHGGITIRSGSFSDPWDSGQLGFIYVSKEKALKEFSQKKWSKKLEEKVIRILDGEIETYDQYLTGDVHGYMIYRPEDEDCEESVDSCWGFYGSKYAMKEAKSLVDWHIENDKKQEKLFNSCLSL